MVTESPARSRVRMAATAARPCPAATGNATYTQSRPRAAKAALCKAGDNEWVTGSPITPATRVLALGVNAGRDSTQLGGATLLLQLTEPRGRGLKAQRTAGLDLHEVQIRRLGR